MAYENYRFISWTDGTPLTGERLAQMSTNIEQVKDATDNRPQGIIQLNQITSDIPNATGYSDFQEYELIALKEDPPIDKRVSVDGNRYYKLTLNFPGFLVKNRGAEDSTFLIKFYQGTFGNAGTLLNTWRLTPPIFSYYDVSSNANQTNDTYKSSGYPTRFGAGDYSVILTSSASGLSVESFYVSIKRDQGASANNAPAYYVPSGGTIMQFYIEDVGGT
jgi:hypothetical protein